MSRSREPGILTIVQEDEFGLWAGSAGRGLRPWGASRWKPGDAVLTGPTRRDRNWTGMSPRGAGGAYDEIWLEAPCSWEEESKRDMSLNQAWDGWGGSTAGLWGSMPRPEWAAGWHFHLRGIGLISKLRPSWNPDARVQSCSALRRLSTGLLSKAMREGTYSNVLTESVALGSDLLRGTLARAEAALIGAEAHGGRHGAKAASL